jgi:hypothetical protein
MLVVSCGEFFTTYFVREGPALIGDHNQLLIGAHNKLLLQSIIGYN